MSLQARLAEVLALIGADIKALQGVGMTDIYRWTTSLDAAAWGNFSATPSNVAGSLRFTNNGAGVGDSRIIVGTVAGRTYRIRGVAGAMSAGMAGNPVLHLGSAANDYGGYGFAYAMGIEHRITAVDGSISVYVETGGGGLGEWNELTELSVVEEPVEEEPAPVSVGMEVIQITASMVLGPEHLNKCLEKAGTSSLTVTIPLDLAADPGDAVTFLNSATSGTLTVSKASGTVLMNNGSVSSVATAAGSMRTLIKSGTANRWVIA